MSIDFTNAVLLALTNKTLRLDKAYLKNSMHHEQPHTLSLLAQEMPALYHELTPYHHRGQALLTDLMGIDTDLSEEFYFKDYLKQIPNIDIVYDSSNINYVADENGDADFTQCILVKTETAAGSEGLLIEVDGCKDMTTEMGYLRVRDVRFTPIEAMTCDVAALIVSGMRIAELDSYVREGLHLDVLARVSAATKEEPDPFVDAYLLNKVMGKDLGDLFFRSLEGPLVAPYMDEAISHVHFLNHEGQIQFNVDFGENEGAPGLRYKETDLDTLVNYVRRIHFLTGEVNGKIDNPRYKPRLDSATTPASQGAIS